MRLRLTVAARHDIAHAAVWYENQEAGLSKSLLSEMKSVLRLIQKNPLMYMHVDEEFHKASLERFPYNIIYRILSGDIEVAAVFHMRRDPEAWRDRFA